MLGLPQAALWYYISHTVCGKNKDNCYTAASPQKEQLNSGQESSLKLSVSWWLTWFCPYLWKEGKKCTAYSIIKDKHLHSVTSLLFTKERSKALLFPHHHLHPLHLTWQQNSIFLVSYVTLKKKIAGKVSISNCASRFLHGKLQDTFYSFWFLPRFTNALTESKKRQVSAGWLSPSTAVHNQAIVECPHPNQMTTKCMSFCDFQPFLPSWPIWHFQSWKNVPL